MRTTATFPRPSSLTPRASSKWFIYILRCSDATLYTGITKDVSRRVVEHNSNDRLAARYTRARRPVTLVHSEKLKTRSAAAKREYEIKQMTREEKKALLKVRRKARR